MNSLRLKPVICGVAGILKAFVGLSGSVFTTVYVGAFKPRMGSFIVFLALGPPALGLLGLVFVNRVAPDARPAPRAARSALLTAVAGGAPPGPAPPRAASPSRTRQLLAV